MIDGLAHRIALYDKDPYIKKEQDDPALFLYGEEE